MGKWTRTLIAVAMVAAIIGAVAYAVDYYRKSTQSSAIDPMHRQSEADSWSHRDVGVGAPEDNQRHPDVARRACILWQSADLLPRRHVQVGTRWPEADMHDPWTFILTVTTPPNKAAAVNAPIAPWFHVRHPWRRVTEQKR